MLARALYRLKVILAVCFVLVAVFLIDLLLSGYLKNFGVFPRSVERLPWIITAPFVHGSWQHLLNNLVGLSVFSAICLAQSVRFYIWSSLFIIAVTGLFVWALGRPSMHIGASGWIFGLWSLSITLAWFDRSLKNILIAVAVILFYGGMAYGVLPRDASISFESHLFGAISGVLCAFVASKFKRGHSTL